MILENHSFQFIHYWIILHSNWYSDSSLFECNVLFKNDFDSNKFYSAKVLVANNNDEGGPSALN